MLAVGRWDRRPAWDLRVLAGFDQRDQVAVAPGPEGHGVVLERWIRKRYLRHGLTVRLAHPGASQRVVDGPLGAQGRAVEGEVHRLEGLLRRRNVRKRLG